TRPTPPSGSGGCSRTTWPPTAWPAASTSWPRRRGASSATWPPTRSRCRPRPDSRATLLATRLGRSRTGGPSPSRSASRRSRSGRDHRRGLGGRVSQHTQSAVDEVGDALTALGCTGPKPPDVEPAAGERLSHRHLDLLRASAGLGGVEERAVGRSHAQAL